MKLPNDRWCATSEQSKWWDGFESWDKAPQAHTDVCCKSLKTEYTIKIIYKYLHIDQSCDSIFKTLQNVFIHSSSYLIKWNFRISTFMLSNISIMILILFFHVLLNFFNSISYHFSLCWKFLYETSMSKSKNGRIDGIDGKSGHLSSPYWDISHIPDCPAHYLKRVIPGYLRETCEKGFSMGFAGTKIHGVSRLVSRLPVMERNGIAVFQDLSPFVAWWGYIIHLII